MSYTNDFVIKFQHYDNNTIPDGGFVFDNINVYSNTKNPRLTDNIQDILHANYPNPFSVSTSVSFSLKENSHVKLEVFNIKGERVSTLMNKNFDSGLHTIIWDSADLCAGIYFMKLMVNEKVSYVQKAIILR